MTTTDRAEIDEQTRAAMAGRVLPRTAYTVPSGQTFATVTVPHDPRLVIGDPPLGARFAFAPPPADPDELATIQTNIATLSRQTLALQQSDEALTAALNQVDQKHDQEIAELRSDVNRQDALDSDLAGRVKAIEARLSAPPPAPAPVDTGGFHYDFKIAPELIWLVLTAAGTVLVQALADVEKVTDYRAWLVGLGAALVRAVFAALMAWNKAHAATV